MQKSIFISFLSFSGIVQAQTIPLLLVKGGTFTMQNTYEETSDPKARSVYVSSFYMSQTEVTQAQYRAVMNSNPSFFQGCDDCPVEQVSWYDAVEFCNALSSKEGLTPVYTIDKQTQDPQNYASSDTLKWSVRCDWSANGYRLPTEAEWEYAARGGKKSKGYKYAGSNDLNAVAWTGNNSNNKTQPVKSKKPNELGFYDMSGNVFEWCWDWNDRLPDQLSAYPNGASTGAARVLRSSSWFIADRPYYSLVGLRSNAYADTRSDSYGLRLVRRK